MKIDFDGIQAFVVTAELGGFNKAADQLHITQTALTRRVQKLEAYLGLKLLDRTTRRVEMTAVGRDFLPQARAIVNAKDTPKIEADTKVPRAKAPRAKALPKPSAVSKVTTVGGQIAKGAAKYALPIVAGIVGATTFAKTGSAAEAGKAAGDVVTSGGVSYYDQARSAGMSKPRAVAEGVVRGAYSMATFGIFDKKLTVPGSTQAKVEKVRGRLANFPRQVDGRTREDFRNGMLEMAGGQRINAGNTNPAERARERVRMSIETAPLTRGLVRGASC